ncbi:MAG: hypothetical protein Q9225_005734 [Loekoesia sp. 1 TL-2023]
MQRISQLSSACRPALKRQRLPAHCISPFYSRQFSQSAFVKYPRKDSQDKDSINTEATEYSKSGTDDESARHEDTAFDPGVTDPGHQKDKVGEKTGVSDNPLEVSPANHEVSRPRSETEGGAESSSASSGSTSARERASGGGSPKKGSKVA